MRGSWQYCHCSKRYNFYVELTEDWVAIYHTDKYEDPSLLWKAYYLSFPAWPKSVSFLEPYNNDELNELPAYKIVDSKYLLVPHDSGDGVQWAKEDAWYDGTFKLTTVSFEEVFRSLTDTQKKEAVWYLDVLRGE